MLMTPTPTSLAGTCPVNSQVISCQTHSCRLPQVPPTQDVPLEILISINDLTINGLTVHCTTNSRKTPNVILDSCPSLSPSPPTPHVINQNGPANLSPEYFLTVSLPYHHYYHCANLSSVLNWTLAVFFWWERRDKLLFWSLI